MKKVIVAICYDFDGTLAWSNMQEYGFMQRLNVSPKDFWAKCDKLVKQTSADKNLAYMKVMLDEAKAQDMAFRREDFAECGKNIKLFKGVEEWFDQINAYADKKNIRIEHYLISSGLEEIVAGTPIYKKFRKVFAGSFIYNAYGEAIWPARTVNYTEKTQYLFRINKDLLDYADDVNVAMPENQRRVPFTRMIYFGDGLTDVPAMSMLKAKGGYRVAVYPPRKTSAKHTAEGLLADGRVNLVARADYSKGEDIDRYVKRVIDKIDAERQLSRYK